jgi:hypothetical protein
MIRMKVQRSRKKKTLISFVVIISLIIVLIAHVLYLNSEISVVAYNPQMYTREHIHRVVFWGYLQEALDFIIIIALGYTLYRILKIGARPLHLTNEIAQKDKEYYDFLNKWNKDENQIKKET